MMRYLPTTIIIGVLLSQVKCFLSFFIRQGFLGDQLDSIPLQLYQQHIYGVNDSCDPCLGTIYIYRQKIKVQLHSMDNQKEYNHYLDRKDNNHFEILASHNQTEVTVIKDILTGDVVEKYTSWVDRTPADGIQWQWNIYFTQQGIQIKASSVQNTYTTLIICLISGFGMLTTLQIFNKKKLQQMTPELVYRANALGIVLTLINQVVLTIYVSFVLVSYLLNPESFFVRIVYYGLLIIPLAACLGISAVLMNAYVRSLRKLIAQKIITLPLFLLSFFYVLSYPFMMSYWPKGELYLCYTTLPIIIQYAHSLIRKKFPYTRYTIFCILQTVFLMLLQKFMPIFHFSQLTLISMIDVLLLLSLEFFIGNFIIRKVVGKEIVNMVQFTNKTRDSVHDISETQKQKNIVTDQNLGQLGQKSIQMR